MFEKVTGSWRKNVGEHVGTFWSVYTWVLGIENVGDDDWDQIYLDRWVPGYINASHPYGKPKTPGNPKKARIFSENLGYCYAFGGVWGPSPMSCPEMLPSIT